MSCPNIGDIEFSPASVQAINKIRKIKISSDKLIKTIGVGHVLNIFLGNDSLKATYSFHSIDFHAMSKAMAAVPVIAKKNISNIADLTYLSVGNYKEKQFWKAVSDGCGVN